MNDIYFQDMVLKQTIIKTCPLCNKGVTITKEIDSTPGFREIAYLLKSKSCNCNIKVDYDTGDLKGGKINDKSKNNRSSKSSIRGN